MSDDGIVINRPALVLITDSKTWGIEPLVETIAEAVCGGVDIVQLRENHLQEDELHALACNIKDAIRNQAVLMINECLPVMFAAKADGIHLKESSETIHKIHDLRIDKRFLISRAVHSLDAAQAAADDFASDFLQFGTVFETPSKPGIRPQGLDALARTCRAVAIPVVAIGGIQASNAADAIRAGASGVAVISAIFGASNPRGAALGLRRSIDTAQRKRVAPIRLRRWADR